jgi:hypothetical protein
MRVFDPDNDQTISIKIDGGGDGMRLAKSSLALPVVSISKSG